MNELHVNLTILPSIQQIKQDFYLNILLLLTNMSM